MGRFSDYFRQSGLDRGAIPENAERSFTGEALSGLKHGAAVTLPNMVGQGMKAISDPGGMLYDAGQSLVDSAAAREKADPAAYQKSAYGQDMSDYNPLKYAYEAGDMAPASLAGAAAAIPVTLAGAPAAVATGVGLAASGGLLGASTFQDTYERGKAAGLSDEDAKAAAWKTGLTEGAGEAAANLIPLKFLTKPFAKAGSKVAKQGIVRSILGAGPFAKEFGKATLKELPVEMGTEFAQSAGQAVVEKDAGIRPDANWYQEGLEGAMAASLMTGGHMAGAGVGGAIRHRMTMNALTNPESNPEARMKALLEVGNRIDAIDPEKAAWWHLNGVNAINNAQPIPLDDSFLSDLTQRAIPVEDVNLLEWKPGQSLPVAAGPSGTPPGGGPAGPALLGNGGPGYIDAEFEDVTNGGLPGPQRMAIPYLPNDREALNNWFDQRGGAMQPQNLNPEDQSLLGDMVAARYGLTPGLEGAHDAASSPLNDHAEPTEGQIAAGNYKKGHVNFQGLDISIENPAGSVRSGKDPDGKQWSTDMTHHYGYIKGTVGKDKDHIDTFIGGNPQSQKVFVVDQIDPKTGKFDEHKVMLGFNSQDEATTGYLANYDETGQSRIGAVTEMTMDDFKAWTKGGKTKQALAYKPKKGEAVAETEPTEPTGETGAIQPDNDRTQTPDEVPPVQELDGQQGDGVPLVQPSDEVTLEELEAEEERIYNEKPAPLAKKDEGNLAVRSKHEEAMREWTKKYREAVKRTEAARENGKKETAASDEVSAEELKEKGIKYDVNSKGEVIVMKDGKNMARRDKGAGTWEVYEGSFKKEDLVVDEVSMREAMDELVALREPTKEEPEAAGTDGELTFDVTGMDKDGNEVTYQVKAKDAQEAMEKADKEHDGFDSTTASEVSGETQAPEDTANTEEPELTLEEARKHPEWAKAVKAAHQAAIKLGKAKVNTIAPETKADKFKPKGSIFTPEEYDELFRLEAEDAAAQPKTVIEPQGMTLEEYGAWVDDSARGIVMDRIAHERTKAENPSARKREKNKQGGRKTTGDTRGPVGGRHKPSTISELTGDLGTDVANAARDVRNAISAIIKGVADPNKLSMGVTIDEKAYAEVKKHLSSAFDNLSKAYHDFNELMRAFTKAIISEVGIEVAPYASRFYREKYQEYMDEIGTDDNAPSDDIIQDEEGVTNDEETDRDDASGSGDVPDERGMGERSSDETGTEDEVEPESGQGSRTDESGTKRDQGRDDGRDVTEDHVITGDLGTGGPKAKVRANLDAIRIAKDILATGRKATPEDRAKLEKYVGWGATELAQLFDESKEKWNSEREELKSLLTPEEYADARRSTQDAHYTSAPVIKAMYEAVKRLGFTGGRILEPSVGIGNFFGLIPPDVKSSSKLFGAELDPTTATIAKTLYPSATIINAPFQDVDYTDDYFDLAIGNPPFGRNPIVDTKDKSLSGLSVHHYFFAKCLKKLRPGGLQVMVVTSRLMDNKDPSNRERLAEQANLVGAIRLPSTTFKGNAGTEVTTDILFLQKLKPGEAPDTKWTDLKIVTAPDGRAYRVNEYFAAHPEMMLGDLTENKLHPAEFKNGVYDSAPGLKAREGVDLQEEVNSAIGRLPENIYQSENRAEEMTDADRVIPKPGEAKVWGYLIRDGKVYQRTPDVNGEMQSQPAMIGDKNPKPIEGKDFERVKGMLGIRDAYRRLQRAELNDEPIATIDLLRKQLNRTYDAFVKEHGPISTAANKRVMRGDINDFPNLLALENSFDAGVTASMAKKYGTTAREPSAKKAAIFTKRQLVPYRKAEKAGTAYDAMMISLAETGRLDFGRMEELTGKRYADLIAELEDKLFMDPKGGHVTADEYLSGNVKKKLAEAKKAMQDTGDGAWERNIKALEKVQPKDVPPDKIAVRIGSHWVPASIYKAFIEHLIGGTTEVKYIKETAKWIVDVKGIGNSVADEQRWGTQYAPASWMLPKIFDGKAIEVRIEDRSGNKVLDKEQTISANNKADEIAAEFLEWIWKDAGRRDKLTRLYNDTVNTDVSRSWNGDHLITPGKVDDSVIELKPHQKSAIWRLIQKGKGLVDHCVGAGKTFTITATAMELRRMGLAKKPMIAVPNHLVGQWAKEIKTLYPSANVLMITKKDFSTKNRKAFIAKIATGDYDAVLIAHSSFGFIDPPVEFERRLLQEQLDELEVALREARRAAGESEDGEDNSRGGRKKRKDPTVKELEAAKERFLNRVKELRDRASDNVLDFDQLGVDALFVDESHEFRSLFYTTRKQRIKGLGNSKGSKRAFDMFVKTQYLLERNNDRGVYFATGTPISNTMAELYTIQRYLSYRDMKARGINQFDAWANTFGREVSDWELDAGGRLKSATRFKKFVNMPELATLYRDFADVVTLKQLKEMGEARGEKWPVPKIKGGKPQNIVVERSEDQTDFMNWIVHRLETMPDDPRIDNHLYATLHARMAGLDLRLLDPDAEDHPGSKVNVAVDNIVRVYDEWSDRKGTQLVFCDLSVPGKHRGKNLEKAMGEKPEGTAEEVYTEQAEKETKGDSESEDTVTVSADEIAADLFGTGFSVYDDVKAKLIARGVPENEIAFIHDFNTDEKKAELFEMMNQGRIRVLIGSTPKMGAGMNVQKKLVALHHLDAPWMPKDMEQREGRIVRQGNEFYVADPENFEIEILRYATKQMYDARMYEINEAKATFTEDFRAGGADNREIEDVSSESVNAAAMKAEASGNPLIRQEIELRGQITKLEAIVASERSARWDLENDVRKGESADEDADARHAYLDTLEERASGHKFRSSDDNWFIYLGMDDNKAFKPTIKDIPETASKEEKAELVKANKEAIATNKGAAAKQAGDDFAKFVKSFLAETRLSDTKHFGAYRGFAIYIRGNKWGQSPTFDFSIKVPGEGESLDYTENYKADEKGNYSFSPSGLFTRLDNMIDNLPKTIKEEREKAEERRKQAKQTAKDAAEELKRPSAKGEELNQARSEHARIVAELGTTGGNIDEDFPVEQRERWNSILERQRAKREAKNRNKPRKYSAEETKDGIPFSGRAKRQARRHDTFRKFGAESWNKNPGWTTSTVNGDMWYGNRRVMLKGEKPDDAHSVHSDSEGLSRLVANIGGIVEPLVYTKGKTELVWFADGTAVNALHFDYVSEQLPGVKFHLDGDARNVIGVLNGEPVAVIAPVKVRDWEMPKNVIPLLSGEEMPGNVDESEEELSIADDGAPKRRLNASALARIEAAINRILPSGVQLEVYEKVEFDPEDISEGLSRHGIDIAGLDSSKKYKVRARGSHKLIRISTGELTSLIKLSWSLGTEETGYHEILHAAESLGVLTESDIKILERAFPSENGVDSTEKRADAFGNFAAGKRQGIPSPVRLVFQKIMNFLNRIRNALEGHGFRTAEDVFNDLYSGKLKSESPNKGLRKSKLEGIYRQAYGGSEQFSLATESLKAVEKAIRDASGTSKMASYAAKAIDRAKLMAAHMGPLGTLPGQSDYLVGRYLALGKIDAAEDMAREMHDALQGLSEDDAKAVYEYWTKANISLKQAGIKDVNAQKTALAVKNKIIEIGRELVDRGLLDEKTYMENLGRYVPRVYLKHILGEGGFKALGTGRKASQMAYLKQRKDIPEEVRRIILSEIKDPGYLAARALSVPLRDMAILDWLEDVSKNKQWVLPKTLVEWEFPKGSKKKKVTPFWLISESERIKDQIPHMPQADRAEAKALADRMYQEGKAALNDLEEAATLTKDFVQLPNTARYGRLRGMYVRKEIHQDLVGTTTIFAGDASVAEKILGQGGVLTQYTQYWKWAKVAANPPAQVRNFISNLVLLHISGVPFHKVPTRIVQAIREIRGNGRAWQIAKKYGVRKATFTNEEMARMERELVDLEAKRSGKKLGWPQMKSLAMKIVNMTGDWYQFMEAVGKTAKILDELEKGASEKDAAMAAHSSLFDYSLVNPNVRYLRNAPIGVPFLTFLYKAVPMMADNFIKHPTRLLPYMIFAYGMSQLVASMTGMDDDDLEALKKALPEWLRDRNHTYLLPFKDDNNRWQFVDLGYFFPWTAVGEMARNLGKGEFGKFLSTSGVLGGPVPSMISAIQTNVDPFTKKQIIDKTGTPAQQAGQLMGYLYALNMPTWVTDRGSVWKMKQAMTNEVNKYGDPKATAAQAGLSAIGVNLYAVEPTRSRERNIKTMEGELTSIKREKTAELKKPGLTADDRADIIKGYGKELDKKKAEIEEYKKASRLSPAAM